jgi:hypothetical protein
VPKRDPHAVLGVEPGSTPVQIKAAWRRLARTHHPDLTGDDPAASRVATQRMAEINDAYAALTRDGGRIRPRWAEATRPDDYVNGGGRRPSRGGPPAPRKTRPVTARVDTTASVRQRNQTLHQASGQPREPILRGHPPLRIPVEQREGPRASTPTGPLARSRVRNFRRPPAPPLDEALGLEMAFGKFHGHTLGQIAAFEPSYIDWLAATITRDPELVAAARVVRDELDRKGVMRRARASDPSGSRRPA